MTALPDGAQQEASADGQRRPRVRRPVMFQNWCSLSFLHWRCDARALQARLPTGLELDTFQQSGWIGLTPFRLTGLRPPGLPPLPWLSTFPETNLRTYVRGPAGPGIWFYSLEAASALAVLGAVERRDQRDRRGRGFA